MITDSKFVASRSARAFYLRGSPSAPSDAMPIDDALHDSMCPPPAGQIIDWSGDVPTLAAEPAAAPVVPAVVTMRQAQLALLAAGLLDRIDAFMATQARAVQITWQTAGTVERVNPLVAGLQAELALTDAQIDELFVQAAGF